MMMIELWLQNRKKSALLAGPAEHATRGPDLSESAFKRPLNSNSPKGRYNYDYGLLLIDMREYAQAKEHAVKAYAPGYPLPGLRKKLAQPGQ
jgi:Tfp pilus assembly protein PilF